MQGHPFRLACFAALALSLAACGGAPSGPSENVPPGGGKGIYKIGQPYQIDGTWYYPAEDWNYEETGIASWYGEQFHGKYTANGEVFNLNELTAAHRTLPMPTVVRVTNLDNGRSIEVRVNDRGPYARGRIIDMSRRAAQLLGFEGQGTAKVRVQIDVPASIQVASLAGRRGTEPALAAAAPAPQAAPVGAVAAEPLPAPPGVSVAANKPVLPPPPAAPQNVPPQPGEPIAEAPLPENVQVVPVRPTGIYIQAGAFRSVDRAVQLKARLEKYGPVNVTSARVSGMNMFRVRVGPIASVDQADALLNQVINTSPEARIVVN
ncbi:MAG TPA: septal ring lytic transglycosylase RlpA family protein [Stellaceae bacterium]|jgi:rare lipoprotein A|nr:septal ring lytic transglycosylase RlpA family protein [Stellaceae bacterium]